MTYRLPGGLRRQIRLRRQAIAKSVVALSQMFFIFYMMNSRAGELINNLQLQTFFDLRGQIEAPEQIVIASIDENSFLEEKLSGLKAWPRELSAEVITNIADAGAKLLIMDLLIDSNTKIENVDAALAQALSKIPSSIAMFEYTTSSITVNNKLEIKDHVEEPSREFSNVAKFLTPMMLRVDPDGIVRRFYFNKRYYDQGRTALPLGELVEFSQQRKLTRIPTPNEYLNYYGPSGSIKTVSINKFLTKNIFQELKDSIKEKIIVIGTFRQTKVDSTSEDQFLTNFGTIFGAEIHATTVANLLNNSWIKRLEPRVESIIIISITIICSFLSISAGPVIGSLTAIISALALIFVSYQMFLREYFLPCLLYSIVIVPILIIGILTYHYFTTLKAFKQVEEALGVSLRPKK